MSRPVVVGLDLSLTGTGIATWKAADVIRSRDTGHTRLAVLLSHVGARCHGADLVVVEGPAFGAKGSAYHQLAGLWWLVAHQLFTQSVPYAVVSPAAVKQYATSKGNAGKDMVLANVVRRFSDVDVNDNNAADALVLAAMGYDHLGCPMLDMPQSHRAALDKVEWPELPVPWVVAA